MDHAKILGLTIPSTLQWNHHVNTIIKKANKRLFCLVQLKKAKLPEPAIINFYCCCIRPILEYAAQIFHHSLPKYLADELERVQKRSLAIIFRGKPYNECLQESGLTTLRERRQAMCKKRFNQITSDSNHKLHNQITSDSNHKLPPENKSKYSLRHPRTYKLPIIHTNRFKNSFLPSMLFDSS